MRKIYKKIKEKKTYKLFYKNMNILNEFEKKKKNTGKNFRGFEN
jgi:hypothetical protein